MDSDAITQTKDSNHDGLFGFPVDRETLFANHKGIYKKGIEKRQTKLLGKVEFLKRFLQEDEKILLITTGCSPTSFLEQYLTGWVFLYIKRSLLVFTDRRIFHIPTKPDYSYRYSIAQILYPDCDSIQMKGNHLLVKYKDGKKEKFLYIAGKERKKIKTMLQEISFQGQPGYMSGRIHLCPGCTRELEEGKYICSGCFLKFKDKDTGRKISLIYPGGGYFYTRHPWLGISDAIVETIFLILVILSLVDVVNGIENSQFDLVFFLILLAVEKAISIYHSNHYIKEFIPLEKDIHTVS